MEEAVVDQKGRIVIPQKIRSDLGLGEGDKVRVTQKGDEVLLTKPVSPELFIQEMEGCIKEGAPLPKVDPLKLKKIWEKP